MLRVHLTTGKTLCFNLDDKEQAKQWFSFSKDSSFQNIITGLTISHNGTQYSVPRPEGYDKIFMTAEHLDSVSSKKFKGGERIITQIDDTRVIVMVHLTQRATRISLTKTGKSVFNPVLEC